MFHEEKENLSTYLNVRKCETRVFDLLR
jgi:hypothetical protein